MEKPIVEFHDYLMGDIFRQFPGITSRRMFGGYGLYKDGNIFGLITSDTDLYFKVDVTNEQQFKELDSHQFVYDGHKNKKPTAMPYWLLPEKILEDAERLFDWVEQSATISKKSKK